MFLFKVNVMSNPDRLGYEDRLLIQKNGQDLFTCSISTAPDDMTKPWIAPGLHDLLLTSTGNLQVNGGAPVQTRYPNPNQNNFSFMTFCSLHRGSTRASGRLGDRVRGSNGCLSIYPPDFIAYQKVLQEHGIKAGKILIEG